ncbi:hypothetical protein EDB85DRAFT_861240 [Lactarius pseudohatsudake]|nr:hypothetical protein EDB85DRAFT_861240 [Lactarius pseudohatsudake]
MGTKTIETLELNCSAHSKCESQFACADVIIVSNCQLSRVARSGSSASAARTYSHALPAVARVPVRLVLTHHRPQLPSRLNALWQEHNAALSSSSHKVHKVHTAFPNRLGRVSTQTRAAEENAFPPRTSPILFAPPPSSLLQHGLTRSCRGALPLDGQSGLERYVLPTHDDAEGVLPLHLSSRQQLVSRPTQLPVACAVDHDHDLLHVDDDNHSRDIGNGCDDD